MFAYTRFVSLKSLVVSAACAAGFAFPAPAFAATITVTTTADTLTNDGNCSIREAIINANNNAATWADCAAGSGADVINLPAGIITITLPNPAGPTGDDGLPTYGDVDQVAALGDFDILSSMTINGNASGTTINGALLDRIFDINPDVDSLPETVTPVITVFINNLTMTNARQNQSGAVRILPRATVTMDRCTVSNSKSWADDGGGIYVFGDGGFPAQHGTLTLTNSTISGNFAKIMGGGIRNTGTLSIVNSTITDNDLETPNFDNQAQGLSCGNPCTLRNSIVAGNGAAPRADTGGTITSLGYNIIGKTTDNAGFPITIITATTGDQFNTGAAAVALQPLANNGGPTSTHELGSSSIAIDKGESSGAATDQRGDLRPCDLAAYANATGGDGADIGAFEVQGTCTTNAAPDAVDDAATFEVNSGLHLIGVLSNDSDPDSDALTVTSVTQGANGVVANNGASVSYTANANFVGPDSFTYTIDDGHSHTDTATVTITVEDTTPPGLAVSTAASALWPPNHQMESIGLSVSAVDNGGGTPAIQVAVFSDEDDLAPGSGNFSPDARDIAPGTLRLRSERAEPGDGRVYLIVVTATDESNNVSHACVSAVVPENQSGAAQTAVAAQAAAAVLYCEANDGTPPAGFVVVGDGPIVGLKQ